MKDHVLVEVPWAYDDSYEFVGQPLRDIYVSIGNLLNECNQLGLVNPTIYGNEWSSNFGIRAWRPMTEKEKQQAAERSARTKAATKARQEKKKAKEVEQALRTLKKYGLSS